MKMDIYSNGEGARPTQFGGDVGTLRGGGGVTLTVLDRSGGERRGKQKSRVTSVRSCANAVAASRPSMTART